MHFLGRFLLKALFPLNYNKLPKPEELELLKIRFGYGKYLLTLLIAAFGLILFFGNAEKIYTAFEGHFHPSEKNGSLFLYNNSGWTLIGLLFPVYVFLVVFVLKQLFRDEYEHFKVYCMVSAGFHIPRLVKVLTILLFLLGLGVTMSTKSASLEAGPNYLISRNWMESTNGNKLNRGYDYHEIGSLSHHFKDQTKGSLQTYWLLQMKNGDCTELHSIDFNHDTKFEDRFISLLQTKSGVKVVVEIDKP
ncbi:MAG: hypothetical protein U0T73_00455 [Chitinophagales bacterium]